MGTRHSRMASQDADPRNVSASRAQPRGRSSARPSGIWSLARATSTVASTDGTCRPNSVNGWKVRYLTNGETPPEAVTSSGASMIPQWAWEDLNFRLTLIRLTLEVPNLSKKPHKPLVGRTICRSRREAMSEAAGSNGPKNGPNGHTNGRCGSRCRSSVLDGDVLNLAVDAVPSLDPGSKGSGASRTFRGAAPRAPNMARAGRRALWPALMRSRGTVGWPLRPWRRPTVDSSLCHGAPTLVGCQATNPASSASSHHASLARLPGHPLPSSAPDADGSVPGGAAPPRDLRGSSGRVRPDGLRIAGLGRARFPGLPRVRHSGPWFPEGPV